MGPLLFSIDLCDLFVIMYQHDIANYADDNTPYVSGKNIDEVVKLLEKASRLILTGLVAISSKEIQAKVRCY